MMGGAGAIRTAVCPHWNSKFRLTIFTPEAASGTRHFTMHVLLGDVILVQPAAYEQVAVQNRLAGHEMACARLHRDMEPTDIVAGLSLAVGTAYSGQNISTFATLCFREAVGVPGATARAFRVKAGGDVPDQAGGWHPNLGLGG